MKVNYIARYVSLFCSNVQHIRANRAAIATHALLQPRRAIREFASGLAGRFYCDTDRATLELHELTACVSIDLLV